MAGQDGPFGQDFAEKQALLGIRLSAIIFWRKPPFPSSPTAASMSCDEQLGTIPFDNCEIIGIEQ
jgi:hypothetical protein